MDDCLEGSALHHISCHGRSADMSDAFRLAVTVSPRQSPASCCDRKVHTAYTMAAGAQELPIGAEVLPTSNASAPGRPASSASADRCGSTAAVESRTSNLSLSTTPTTMRMCFSLRRRMTTNAWRQSCYLRSLAAPRYRTTALLYSFLRLFACAVSRWRALLPALALVHAGNASRSRARVVLQCSCPALVI